MIETCENIEGQYTDLFEKFIFELRNNKILEGKEKGRNKNNYEFRIAIRGIYRYFA